MRSSLLNIIQLKEKSCWKILAFVTLMITKFHGKYFNVFTIEYVKSK